MYPRYATQNIGEALSDTAVVFVMRPRQAGKTTLVKSLIDEEWEYITLDDQVQLEITNTNPVGGYPHLPCRLGRCGRETNVNIMGIRSPILVKENTFPTIANNNRRFPRPS